MSEYVLCFVNSSKLGSKRSDVMSCHFNFAQFVHEIHITRDWNNPESLNSKVVYDRRDVSFFFHFKKWTQVTQLQAHQYISLDNLHDICNRC